MFALWSLGSPDDPQTSFSAYSRETLDLPWVSTVAFESSILSGLHRHDTSFRPHTSAWGSDPATSFHLSILFKTSQARVIELRKQVKKRHSIGYYQSVKSIYRDKCLYEALPRSSILFFSSLHAWTGHCDHQSLELQIASLSYGKTSISVPFAFPFVSFF